MAHPPCKRRPAADAVTASSRHAIHVAAARRGSRVGRWLAQVLPLCLVGLAAGCGGSSGGSDTVGNTPAGTTIAALTVHSVSSDSATVAFTTDPASAATVRLWLGTDGNAAEPLLVTNSDEAVEHRVQLDPLWSATPWRVEVSAGPETASTTFTTGNPPWSERCRAGDLTLPVNGAGSWSTYTDTNGSVAIAPDPGCDAAGIGARFTFDLGAGEWVVAASNDPFPTPVDLSGYTHLWVPFRGTADVAVAFEVKLRDDAGGLSVARLEGGAGLPVWRSWAVDLREFEPQTGALDLTAVTALEFAFSWPLSGAGPRTGTVRVGPLSAWNVVARRPDVTGFERTARNDAALAAIAADLLARQRPHGFIPAWFELEPDWHLYANAMALIVFALEYERLAAIDDPAAGAYRDAASLLANRLVELQELSARDGAWDDSFLETNGTLELRPGGSRAMWVGSTAWAGIALIIARDLLPDGNQYEGSIAAAAGFYAARQNCRQTAGLPMGSVTEGTEGNISSHLFLDAAADRGLASAAAADALGDFIGATLFDAEQQRFFCGVRLDLGSGFDEDSCFVDGSGAITGVDARGCLDVTGNWGAEWLKHRGRPADALSGLAFSRQVFTTEGFADPRIKGLGDIAGPWTPTVEHGAGQWAAAGGPDSNYVMAEAYARLCSAGACRGAADDFTAGIGWNTRSTGIAPAAWMYIAWHGGFWSRLHTYVP